MSVTQLATHVIGLVTRVILITVLITVESACGMTHPGTHQLAIALAAELKPQVCKVSFMPGHPCGDRNVQSEGDAGIATYVYIYGVNDQSEMQMLVDTATKLRDGRVEPDRRIPIHITFYADLTKSHEIKTIKIKGN